ncbi:Melatonin receptor type 1A [Acropora cervicornis]|uniref:Melatonin receptor type 1A n=1 Tax=Acropora cervicornis TaxID=6130 RepID=A0AAD9R1X7_ACRCE|nr:Melatonin receptor type 1A [Acropora cervicornis]
MYEVSPLYAELASRSQFFTIAELFLYTFIVCVGTVGNYAVLLVLYKNRRLRNILACFVISLAISDIIMLNICSPFSMGVLIVGEWIFGYFFCQMSGFLVMWLACASIGTLALVAINRYFHIVKSSLYRSIFTPTKSKLIVLGGWLAALTIPLSYTAAGKQFIFQPGKLICSFEYKFSFLVLPFHIFIGISMVILIACYVCVFKAMKVHERTVVNNLRNGNTRPVTLLLEDVKLTKILFATVVGFIICWSPVLVLDIVDTFLGTGWHLPREIYYMYTIFGTTSSAINPIVYGVMNPSYRRAYMRLCGLRRVGRVGDSAETNAHEHLRIKTGKTHLRE